jgi:hypothetical protein
MPIDALSQKSALIKIPMRSIAGLDRDLQSYLQQAEFHPAFPLDPVSWQREVLEALYFLQPLVVVARGKPRAKKMLVVEKSAEMLQDELGSAESMANPNSEAVESDSAEYQVVGSVLTWALAEELSAPDDLIPVRCLEVGRMSKADKMCLLAAELLATPGMHWLGKKGPRIRQALWESFLEVGFNPLAGVRLSDFKSATRATYR